MAAERFKIKKEVSLNTILWIVGGVGAYAFVLRPILKAAGWVDSKDDDKADSGEKLKGFDPEFWQKAAEARKAANYLTQATAYAHGKVINNAFGLFNDKESIIFGEFKKLKSQIQVSQVAYYFQRYFGENLFFILRDKLSDEEMARIVKMVSALPLYK